MSIQIPVSMCCLIVKCWSNSLKLQQPYHEDNFFQNFLTFPSAVINNQIEYLAGDSKVIHIRIRLPFFLPRYQIYFISGGHNELELTMESNLIQLLSFYHTLLNLCWSSSCPCLSSSLSPSRRNPISYPLRL